MLITDESNSSSNTNEWINQDIQWFQARYNHRRKKSNKHFKDNSNTWSIYILSSIKKSHLPNEFQFQPFISLREVDFFGK